MKRPWLIWTAFGLCLIVVLATLGWATHTVLRLERAESLARQKAAEAEAGIRRHAVVEENVRLALWRMETTLAPILAEEFGRPYFTYQAFYPAERAYTRMFEQLDPGEVMIPSPLLGGPPRFVRIHFQLGPEGELTSPQAPKDALRELAEAHLDTPETLAEAAERLDDLAARLDRDHLLSRLRERSPLERTELPKATVIIPYESQMARSAYERNARFNVLHQIPRGRENRGLDGRGDIRPDVHEGPFEPVWVDDALLLIRRLTVEGKDYVQGSWLDWPAIRSALLDEVVPLLPNARLVPVRDAAENDSRLLAALPVQLVPGSVPAAAGPVPAHSDSSVSIIASLVIAWGCVVLSAAAVAVLISGTLKLSERRAAFVSAVTHEMRTPLTTLRMYTEMLADDMVPAGKRRGYLHTLRSEAERLGNLVENVLAYARIERLPSIQNVESMAVGAVLDNCRDQLARRAEAGGMCLAVECDGDIAVKANPTAVEQILFNLVDNASKYAAAADDRTIHLAVRRDGDEVRFSVRDHGPGVRPGDERRLFQPFRKSAREAASTAPGVGLGLALSRRLARQMGGDLELDSSVADGAGFVLRLPADGSPREPDEPSRSLPE